MEKGKNCSFIFSTIFCYLLLNFHVKTGARFSLRDKRLFEISEVEIMRVDCTSFSRSLDWLVAVVSGKVIPISTHKICLDAKIA